MIYEVNSNQFLRFLKSKGQKSKTGTKDTKQKTTEKATALGGGPVVKAQSA
ncbi:hypothetical protein AKO1_003708 [Acrasis kona]|uniref:Uncharacterized protein n=1 Tax=Acrasis kona TaxID=1008807 RepID=A0AAW2Z5P9_9EUKA